MRRLGILSVFIAVVALSATQASAVETVTLLDRGEPYDSMLVENGIVWIGQSRLQFNANYRLEAYRTDGTLLDRVTLSHSLSTMKAATNGSIMITGICPQSNLTRYTTAKVENGKIKFSTKEIALGGFITFWVANVSGRQFFVDIGGNPDDNSDPSIPQPAQTIFASTGSNASYLSARVRMPVSGTSLNDKLLLVSSEGIGSSAASLVEVDPRTSAVRVISKSPTAKYKNIQVLPGTTDLITNALSESKVKIIDSVSGQIRREFQTKGYPRSFVTAGHCILVGNDETNVVEVFDINAESTTPAFAEEVKMAAEEFSGIKSIAIDQASGTVFARAARACNPIMEACDHDNNRVIKFDQEFAARVKSACY